VNPRPFWAAVTDVALFVILVANIAALMYLLIEFAPTPGRGYDPSQEEVVITR